MLAFDRETQRTLDEVGGRGGIHRLRLAVGVTYDLNAGRFDTYQEEDAADRVVGYNV